MITIKIKKLHPNAMLPTKAHDDDFCFDLVATSCEQIAPNVYKYGFGLALQVASTEYIQDKAQRFALGFTIRPRSSVWKTGMVLSNSIGTIDQGYTGEISAVFYHVLPNMPRYEVGDRVAQLHMDATFKHLEFNVVDELEQTERGDGGYGSTGTK